MLVRMLVAVLAADTVRRLKGCKSCFYICMQSAVLMNFLSSKNGNHQSKVIVVLRFL